MTDAPVISLQTQIDEAQLHALPLRDFVARFDGGRKRPQHEVEQQRGRAEIADAIVRTLQDLSRERGASA